MAINREIEKIDSELSECFQAGTLDSFCKYLYGIVLVKRQRKSMAIKVLIDSVNQYPFNWSAWQELGTCLPTYPAVAEIKPDLPESFMTTYFLSHVTLEYFNHQNEDGAEWLEELTREFPRSAYVKCERALAFYHAREFPDAAKVFEELIKDNPHRLDNLDVFSNVLFVTDSRAKLSFLAHSSAATDNFRPETCCIIGNYYSMKGEHEKAVVYFKRALRFNRSYASAWTLLGHEYLEMKNTYAAVEAYRRAVDYNHRDYRAWNGLGQTYEALKMHYYALNYYQRATAIRPYDGRMWCAMAECYEYLDQDLAAIKCYTRALLGTDQEKTALKKLPKLYKKIGDTEAAARYFRRSLEQLREEQSESEDTSEACIYLAIYERAKGNLIAASEYATEALHCLSVQHQEDAKALLRDIRSVLDAESHNPGDMLAGPLEYAWSSMQQPSQQGQPLVAQSLGGDILKALQLAFDRAAIGLGQNNAISNKRPNDCNERLNAATDAWTNLIEMMDKALAAHPMTEPVLEPMRKALAAVPSNINHDDQTMLFAIPRIQMGLIGFQHIVQYIPERTASELLSGVISGAETLRQKSEDALSCEDFASSQDSGKHQLHPSCAIVQVFYDDYLIQVKAKVEAMTAETSNKSLLQAALASLQFQSSGTYLTHQGAKKFVDQLERSDFTLEVRSLVETMRLVIAAGDALQACQISIQKNALRQEVQLSTVSDFEHLMYSHLLMNMRRKDPIMRQQTNHFAANSETGTGCEQLYVEAISKTKAIARDAEAMRVMSADLEDKLTQSILKGFAERVERTLANLTKNQSEVQLLQLETVLAVLVETLKRIPGMDAYAMMKRMLDPIAQMSEKVRNLHGCVMINPTPLQTNRDGQEYGEGHRQSIALACDFLTESLRDTLAWSLQLADLAWKKDKNSRKKIQEKDRKEIQAQMEALQDRVEELAKAADLWDEDVDALAENVFDTMTGTPSWKKDAFQPSDLMAMDMSGFFVLESFLIAQANSLEACTRVQQATSGREL
ncbi:Anaphase-promoting complex subunit 23 [Haplosporangium sp. Z 11]|nr:Anaphase-promoting complex subunit 23 [Haplosporangium sp. Z 11]